MDNPILIALIAAPVIVGIILVIGVIKLVKRLKRKRLPPPPPLSPEEQTETSRLDALREQYAIVSKQLDQARREWTQKTNEIPSLKAEIDSLRNILANVQAEAEAIYVTCHSCGAKGTSRICKSCGVKIKSMVLPYKKVNWDEVTSYFYSIAEWGDQSDFAYDASVFLLPWPTNEETTFKVGGIEYTWGKMEDEEEDGGWWAYLKYEHPIVGTLTLINKINSDGDHLFRDDYHDDEQLNGGDYSDLRSDLVKGLKQGMTALYLWMQDEKVS